MASQYEKLTEQQDNLAEQLSLETEQCENELEMDFWVMEEWEYVTVGRCDNETLGGKSNDCQLFNYENDTTCQL